MVQLQPAAGWATYLRVSDEDKQTPERSFDMQRRRIAEQLLRTSEVPFYREYRDLLTGTTPQRTDYQQMLADAEARRFSHLGLYRADRFGRDTIEGLQAATRLIGLGVKIRMAHMPSLEPENPDGFFMFLLQTGLAQREVDIMRERIHDGMVTKLRGGGWVWKAPDGYLNKEEQVSSGKYRRWVEIDPARRHILREAWDLLLSDRYSLAQICEELTARGYTQRSGKPWAWADPRTGSRRHATNTLSKIFNNPFYAGWVVSDGYDIAIGEVRGSWEPIVAPHEYERGISILRKNRAMKSRHRRHFYLLRGLLWMEIDGERYKRGCSTPTGRSRSYSYYISNTDKKPSVRCEVVDAQILDWLQGITVDPTRLPEIRQIYAAEIQQVTEHDREARITTLNRRVVRLRAEEAQLARLLLANKITEETYDQLRSEWQEQVEHAEVELQDLERDTAHYLDDLESK